MIDIDPETKDEEGNYHVGLRLPCGKEITVLVPSEGMDYDSLMEDTSLRKHQDPIGLNLVFRGHYR